MTVFLRLLKDPDKAQALSNLTSTFRLENIDSHIFQLDPDVFKLIPASPFAYWVSEDILRSYERLPAFGQKDRFAKQGLATEDDLRFVRNWWEAVKNLGGWAPLAKGGEYSPYYLDLNLVIDWKNDGANLKAAVVQRHGNVGKRIYNEQYYFLPGVTWTQRTTSELSVRALPSGSVFSCKGQAAFAQQEESKYLLSMLGIFNLAPFRFFINLRVAAGDAAARSYDNGIFQITPFPELDEIAIEQLSYLSRDAWSKQRSLDTISEISHAFLLPIELRHRVSTYDQMALNEGLQNIQEAIDKIALDLYGFDDVDRGRILGHGTKEEEQSDARDVVGAEHRSAESEDTQTEVLSWCVGVAFGRFDWRLATGEREPLPDPEHFDPLPTKSPGMLPDGVDSFHAHAGILLDDPGHPHDLARLVESIHEQVGLPVPPGVRRWLQRDFFPEHLKQYSKSRRKAPIYWPLATASGSYTLWVYYPTLTGQTLYTAINDFVDRKLQSVNDTVQALRGKTDRSKAEEKELEQQQDFELELTDLRDNLLQIAKDYAPDHDDGVQITAAPLWSLFRHKPWQKVLKDSWQKLEKGDYDWAHLAMNYWPDRVREKCKTDKSLAIAHGLEALYEEPPEQPKKKRRRGKEE